jgi:hypothetical protein
LREIKSLQAQQVRFIVALSSAVSMPALFTGQNLLLDGGAYRDTLRRVTQQFSYSEKQQVN